MVVFVCACVSLCVYMCMYVCMCVCCVCIIRMPYSNLTGNTSKSVYIGSSTNDTNSVLVRVRIHMPGGISPPQSILSFLDYHLPYSVLLHPISYSSQLLLLQLCVCMVLLPYMQPVKQHHLYAPPDDITARAQRIGITIKEVYVSAHTIIGVVLLQSQKEAVKVMVQWSNDDWATFHDTRADLITSGAHDDMELFQFDISAEKTLHIHFALYYCTIHNGMTCWDNNYGQNYNFELTN